MILLLACRLATPVDACDLDPANCLPCSRDADCGYSGNPCLETVYCAHKDAQIAVIEIGCSSALEYAWPDEASCRCVENACKIDE